MNLVNLVLTIVVSGILAGVSTCLWYFVIKPRGRWVNAGMICSGALWGVFWLLFAVYTGGEKATMPLLIAVFPVIAGLGATVVAFETKAGFFTRLGAPLNLIQKIYILFAIAGITWGSVTHLNEISPIGIGFLDIVHIAIQPGKLVLPILVGGGLLGFLWLVKLRESLISFLGTTAGGSDLLFWALYGVSVTLAIASAPVWLMGVAVFASLASQVYHIGMEEHWTSILGGYIGLSIRWFIMFGMAGGISTLKFYLPI